MTQKKTKKEPSKFAYNPLEVEGRWTRFWFDNNLFDSKFVPGRPNFYIALPPPNITGDLHMGHALNGTLQDILIRIMRMRGFNVLWQPGTDHAGISAQMVVERQLKTEGKNRHDMGRDQFIKPAVCGLESYGKNAIPTTSTSIWQVRLSLGPGRAFTTGSGVRRGR